MWAKQCHGHHPWLVFTCWKTIYLWRWLGDGLNMFEWHRTLPTWMWTSLQQRDGMRNHRKTVTYLLDKIFANSQSSSNLWLFRRPFTSGSPLKGKYWTFRSKFKFNQQNLSSISVLGFRINKKLVPSKEKNLWQTHINLENHPLSWENQRNGHGFYNKLLVYQRLLVPFESPTVDLMIIFCHYLSFVRRHRQNLWFMRLDDHGVGKCPNQTSPN